MAATDRRPAETEGVERRHLPVQPRRAVLQGQAIRHALLRRHLRLHVRQEGRRQGRCNDCARDARPAQSRRTGSKEGRHHAVSDPEGLQDERRRAQRILVDGVLVGRPTIQRGAGPGFPDRRQDCRRRPRMDARRDAHVADSRSEGVGARRDAGTRRVPQRAGRVHVERRQRVPAREQPRAQQARRRRRDDPLPRPQGRYHQRPDGLDAPLRHQRRHQGARRCVAADLLHGRQGCVGQLFHREGLVSEVWRRLRVQVARQRSRHHRGAAQGRL